MFSAAESAELRARYLAGGMGYGHAKQALAEKYSQTFAARREQRQALLAEPRRVEDILQAGAARARAVARETLDRVRAAVGVG